MDIYLVILAHLGDTEMHTTLNNAHTVRGGCGLFFMPLGLVPGVS